MKALIVEDEKMAQANLARMLKKAFPEMEIVAMIDSVRGAVEFLSAGPELDVIFMDVELADGICFEIFRCVQVSAPVIMTRRSGLNLQNICHIRCQRSPLRSLKRTSGKLLWII